MQPCVTACLLLRAPVLGAVKTRLAAGVGERYALEIYRRLAEHQLKQLPPEWRVEVHFTPASDEPLVRAWLKRFPAVEFFVQPEGDLGARLTAAQSGAFCRGAKAVVLLGADCPELDPRRLREAEKLLREHELVVVPTRDGGYALLGATGPQPMLFAQMIWSTPTVFGETIRRAAELQLKVAKMPMVSDVDEVGDWERLKHLVD